MAEPYTRTDNGLTQSAVQCGCALWCSAGLPTLHPCSEAHALLLQGGGRTNFTRQIIENKDSLELGTPGKEGAIKLYTDFSDQEATRKRIDLALSARAYLVAQAQGKKEA